VAPTLIVWGDRDVFLPRSDQEALAAEIEAELRDYGYPDNFSPETLDKEQAGG